MININKNAYINMALGQLIIKMHLMYMGEMKIMIVYIGLICKQAIPRMIKHYNIQKIHMFKETFYNLLCSLSKFYIRIFQNAYLKIFIKKKYLQIESNTKYIIYF